MDALLPPNAGPDVAIQAEAALRDRAALLEATSDCVLTLDPGWRVTFVNRRAMLLLPDGATLAGRVLWDAYPERVGDPFWQACHHAMRDRAGARAELRCERTGRLLEAESHPVEDGGIVVFFRDVTEARAAAARLAESEARFRAVAEAVPGILFATDAEGRNTYTNAFFQDYAGLSAEALLGEGWLQVLHPEDRERAALAWAEAVRSGAPYDIEYRLRRADGAYRWFLARGAPAREAPDALHAAGRITGWFGTCTDIDDLKRAEAALRERTEVLRLSQEGAGIASYVQDLPSGDFRWLPGSPALFGFPPGHEAMTLDAWRAVRHPDDLARSDAERRENYARGATDVRYEFRIRRPDTGAVQHLEIRARREFDSAHRPVRAFGVAIDVTERHAAEAALRESEARFRTLIEAMPHLAFIAAPDGRVEFRNRRYHDFAGVPVDAPDDVLRAAVVHPEDLDRTLAAWARALESGDPLEIEHRLRGRDGAHRWFLTRALPLRDAGGRIIRWFGTLTDIADMVAAREAAAGAAAELERRVAERTRALAAATAELRAEMARREEAQAALLQKQKLEALGQLTGGIAHDFNNVLAAITGGYRLIEKRCDDPKVLEFIRHGDQAAKRAAALVRQLLAFARREELRPAVLDIADLLDGAEDMLRHTVGSRLGLALRAEPGLWPVLADRHQLEVALLNLAANARDAMPGGGLIALAARNLPPAERPVRLRSGDYVSVSVRDDGLGMPPEVLARAAEPFFTTKPRGKGTGLGLAMVHGFAEQSGGCVRIESRPGEGTLVEIVLPRAALTGLDPAEAAEAAAPDPGLHGDAHILLAEDDAQVRAVTAAFLRELGYAVTAAASAEAALALAHGLERLDLLLTDMDMPGTDGAALAARLREARPGLPVLFVTGRPPGPALAGEAVLRKPATGAGLSAAVLRRLGRAGAPPSEAPAERLLARLRAPALRQAYLDWHAARTPGEALPRAECLDLAAPGLAEHAVLMAVGGPDSPGGWRLVSAGSALARPHAAAAGAGPGLAALLDAASDPCRRCAEAAAPSHDTFDLPAGRLDLLLLPLSEDGETVSLVAALALPTEEPAGGAP